MNDLGTNTEDIRSENPTTLIFISLYLPPPDTLKSNSKPINTSFGTLGKPCPAAAGQGLPKVPKDVLMGLEFDLSVSGGGKYRDMKIRVVGFSDRISSVLVPKSFMTWAHVMNDLGTNTEDIRSENPTTLIFISLYLPPPDTLKSNSKPINTSFGTLGKPCPAAAGQGLPKVPKDVLMGLEFDLSVSGGGKYRDMKIRVVGFSDRISSVLVPKSFMTWANSYFGEQSTNYSRLIIKVKDLASPDLSYELNKLNLELNKELLGGKVVNRVAIISSTIILCFGLMVFLLSALLIISTLKLKLVAIKENLRLLSQIGYSQSQILKAYLKPLFRNALVLTILNTFVYLLTKKQINNWYKQLGLNIDNFSLTPVVLMFVLVTLVVLLTRNTVVKILRQNPS